MTKHGICIKCHVVTENVEPIEIIKYGKNRYGLKATCAKCGKKKSMFIKKDNLKKLPSDLKKTLDELEPGHTHSGGILPFLPLILAGIGAASGVAGTVASAVQNAQKNSEQERHNKELEKIAQGSSLDSESITAAIETLKKSGYGIHFY